MRIWLLKNFLPIIISLAAFLLFSAMCLFIYSRSDEVAEDARLNRLELYDNYQECIDHPGCQLDYHRFQKYKELGQEFGND